VRSIDPLLPLTQVQTMEQVVSQSEASRRFNTALISSFAFAAVLLAILGIYSVIAFSVASRVQEMATRMTLGSQRSAIVRLVLKSAAKLAAIGCVIGLTGAAAASGLLRSMLFGVSPFDPLVLLTAASASCGQTQFRLFFAFPHLVALPCRYASPRTQSCSSSAL